MNHFQFAAIFTNKRKELNVTQEEIARYVGVSRAAVSKWEKGLSYPDILLLPKLAAYFNLSIDDLLGYESQMTEQRILETYANLAEAFSKKPYEEVDAQIDALLAEYYSCFPLILKMAQLYVNYVNLAPQKERAIEKIQKLCVRVKEKSGNYKLANEAIILEALSYIVQEEPQKVLQLLGEDVVIQLGSDQLIAMAQTMLGNTEKAKGILQVNMYQQLLATVLSATETLILEVENPAYFDETVHRVEVLINTFKIEQLNVNVALVFYLKAASGYAMQNRLERTMNCIECYVKICTQINFPLRLVGDDYFYLLENWMEREVFLSSQAPRDDETIKHALYEGIAANPLFANLLENARFKNLLINLQHHLRLKEGIKWKG